MVMTMAMTMTTRNKHYRINSNAACINARLTVNIILILTIIGGFVVNNPGPVRLVSAYSPRIVGVSTFNACARSSLYRNNKIWVPTTTFFSKPRKWEYKNEKVVDYGTMISSTRLYHMGHSHSHHDHGHDHSKTNKPKTFNRKRMIRKLAVVLFCWMATCGTKLLQTAVNVNGTKRFVGLSQNDWISFVMTSVALTSSGKIQRTVQRSVDNFRKFVDGIRKHSSKSAAYDAQQENQINDQSQQRIVYADTSDADRVTWIGVAINLLLSVGKLGIGITSHSSALVADAGHSLSDLVSDFITLWSMNIARMPPDDDHPYGHYKFEAIGSLFLSLTLLATGGSVGLMANKQLMKVLHVTTTTGAAATTTALVLPGPLALVMAGLSIASKEWLFRITKKVGERLRSPVVIANAWHHRSDAYSSVLALLSIAWAMTGFPLADAAAGMMVAGMICMTGTEILIESVKQLSDSADSDLQKEVVEILDELDDDDIIATTSVRARQMGYAVSVDVTVEIPSVLSTTATRAVENRVKQRLLVELDKRRGGDDDGNDFTSSSGVIANVYAKPYLDISLMEDFEKLSLTMTTTDDDATTFAKLVFEKFDADVDGRLSIEELKSGLEKTLKIELSTDRVQKLMDEFDENKDGFLQLEEMVTIDKFKKRIEAFSKEETELATRQEQQQQQQTLLDDMPSTTYIEQQVRNEAKLMYPKIRSVEGVTVHYTSQNSVTVDVNIRITEDDKNKTTENHALREVREHAQELKKNLETKLHEIESARVYLDLNTDYDKETDLTLNGTTASSSSLAT